MTNYSNTLLYKALKDKYVAQISEAEATMEIYFEKAVGIGEHPQHVEEMDKSRFHNIDKTKIKIKK